MSKKEMRMSNETMHSCPGYCECCEGTETELLFAEAGKFDKRSLWLCPFCYGTSLSIWAMNGGVHKQPGGTALLQQVQLSHILLGEIKKLLP